MNKKGNQNYMENVKFESKFKIGEKVKIINKSYYSYYGFSDCDLIVKDLKTSESDNFNLDSKVILKLETIKERSIEGENKPIWVSEDDVALLKK